MEISKRLKTDNGRFDYNRNCSRFVNNRVGYMSMDFLPIKYTELWFKLYMFHIFMPHRYFK